MDVVLDTDAYNEIDDQYAIAYLLRSQDVLSVKAFYAAPFFNSLVNSAKEGMEKSFTEIEKILTLMGEEKPVFKGSERYLPNENTPVLSDAAKDLCERAKGYSRENPLYVVAIAAITNIASAILLEPNIKDSIVVVWLGGNAWHFEYTDEFNMSQDIAAARVVMRSGVRFVQLPCAGVVDSFTLSCSELKTFFLGKNPLADYLAKRTVEVVSEYVKDDIWSRVIWDVTAVAWLLNENNRFMKYRTVTARIPDYSHQYEENANFPKIQYVYHIERDALMRDMIEKITK